jgi:hypothetical protein
MNKQYESTPIEYMNDERRENMPKYFSDNPTEYSRAVQIWQILISKAHNHQILSYNELGKLLRYKGYSFGELRLIFDKIDIFCNQNRLPHLTCLVLTKETGLPSIDSNWSAAKLNKERAEVFEYDWFNLYPPSEEELKGIFKKPKPNR